MGIPTQKYEFSRFHAGPPTNAAFEGGRGAKAGGDTIEMKLTATVTQFVGTDNDTTLPRSGRDVHAVKPGRDCSQ
jgi:hypothetical protein